MKNRILAAAVTLAACGTAQADDWKLSVTPYFWATDVGFDLAVRDRKLLDTSIAFDDLLEDLESAALLRTEAMRGEHGVALDLFDVTVADDSGPTPLPGSPDAELAVDAEVGMTIFDLTGIYDPEGDGRGLALRYGARILEQREDIAAHIDDGSGAGLSAHYEADDRFVDALVGARYEGRLAGRWSYEFAADISTGDTELTWSIAPAISYTFGAQEQYRLTAGYRHMAVDFDTEPQVDLDMTLSGLLVGFRFSF